MRVCFQTLARLERGYSISAFPTDAEGGLPSFVCGSEGEDALLLFDPSEFVPRVIARQPGGYISTAPVVLSGRRHVIAATQFKPGFDGADAKIRLFPLDEEGASTSTLIVRMPYTHRIAHLSHGGLHRLLISTLCGGKADRDDWSQPGGIHLAEAPADPRQPWRTRQIVSGLRKNHGMDFARLGRSLRPGYLLSCMDGLRFLPLPANPEGPWPDEIIDPAEHSDAFAFDWDGDGEPEVFSIAPFHGHVLSMHKRSAEGWRRTMIHDDLAMGHIVWAGELLGAPALLAGSRRERRELRLYRPTADGGVDRDYQVLAEDIGPTQIAVVQRNPRSAILYVAAHGQNEVRLYGIEV